MEHSNTQSVRVYFKKFITLMNVVQMQLFIFKIDVPHFYFMFHCNEYRNNYNSDMPFQGAAKVSKLMIGQQAIMDAYLCLLHLTAGILVGKFFKSMLALLPLK